MSTLSEVKLFTTNLITCLEEIKTNAFHILKKLEPVMKKLKDENSDIVSEGVKKYPEYKQSLQENMKNVTVEWIKDASMVVAEIDKLLVVSAEGIVFQFPLCPFFEEIWNGDAYDKSELDALKELNEDLKKQFSAITRENLYGLAIKKIKNES